MCMHCSQPSSNRFAVLSCWHPNWARIWSVQQSCEENFCSTKEAWLWLHNYVTSYEGRRSTRKEAQWCFSHVHHYIFCALIVGGLQVPTSCTTGATPSDWRLSTHWYIHCAKGHPCVSVSAGVIISRIHKPVRVWSWQILTWASGGSSVQAQLASVWCRSSPVYRTAVCHEPAPGLHCALFHSCGC